MPPIIPAAVGWGLLGLGVGLAGTYLLTRSQTKGYENTMAQAMNYANANPIAESLPAMPSNPDLEQGAVMNPEADAAKQQLAAQAAEQEQMYNPTGGLGITNNAIGKRKSLGNR